MRSKFLGTSALLVMALASSACGKREVRIHPAKAPPGAVANGDTASLPLGTAVVVDIDTGGDDTVELVGNASVRVWPTTRERVFVLVGQNVGEGPVQIKVEGNVEKTIAVTVTKP